MDDKTIGAILVFVSLTTSAIAFGLALYLFINGRNQKGDQTA